jgi:hypothetical protein
LDIVNFFYSIQDVVLVFVGILSLTLSSLLSSSQLSLFVSRLHLGFLKADHILQLFVHLVNFMLVLEFAELLLENIILADTLNRSIFW